MAIARGLCVTGDVQRINAHRNYLENDLLDARTDVADIEGYIDFKIDDIYQSLKTVGYTVPLVLEDSPYGYRFCSFWNATGAAYMCESMHGDDEVAKGLLDDYNEMERQILEQEVLLTDVPGVPTQGDLTESGTSNLSESGEVKVPFFTRLQKF